MLIVGAKGFAKEILEILHQKNETKNLCFYDDVNDDIPDKLYNEFPILKSLEEVQKYFKNISSEFTLGIGNPTLRRMLYDKFVNLGGNFTCTFSKYAEIGSFGVKIEEGCNIMSGVKISNDVRIGKGTMIYYNTVITHDVEVGQFVEISPNVTVLGRAQIGDFVHLATGAIIFPDVKIGNNSIIAAGAVVSKDVPKNTMVAGIPAIIKKNF